MLVHIWFRFRNEKIFKEFYTVERQNIASALLEVMDFVCNAQDMFEDMVLDTILFENTVNMKSHGYQTYDDLISSLN